MDTANMPSTVPIKDREWFVLFSICVAGKSAKQTQEKLNEYLRGCIFYEKSYTPFDVVRGDIAEGDVHFLDTLKKYKFGQYSRIEKAFREVVKLDVKTDLTVEKLEAIPGIGPKTARFIVLYTDPNAEVVPLDTHILKFLATFDAYESVLGFKVPKSTPPAGARYRALEQMFQTIAKGRGKTVRQLDTEVWQSYARR